MKSIKIVLLCLILLPLYLAAIETIQPYQPTYLIAGDKENQVKYQISFKYGLWYPYNSGLFLSYTQLAKWNLYDKSSPFRETNYNPSVFWEKGNVWKFDFLRIIPYEHKSNGRDGEESRSIDRGFLEAQASIGEKLNLGIREKVGYFYAVSNKNKDIKRYIGNFETELFAQIKSQHGYLGHEKLSFAGEWTNKFYWYKIELSFRIFTTKIRPHVYVQYYNGYGEFLLNYNKKSNALRAGLIFNPE